MCSLPWMKNAKICVNARRRRSVSANMSVGFGPVVLPDDQELANERPSGNNFFISVSASFSGEIGKESNGS